MAADLFVRLGLMADGYVQGINSAKATTMQFEQAMAGAKAVVGKLAAAVGVAGGAYEAFNRTMQASQTTADAYDVAIAGAKASVDAFFQSISTGDWSNFIHNIGYAIEQGMALQRVLDELGDKKDAFAYAKSDSRVALAKARDIIYDTESTKEQKREALKQARELINQNKEIAEEVAQKSREAMVTTAKIALKGNITEEELDHFFKELLPGLNRGFNDYSSRHAELSKQIAIEKNKTELVHFGDGSSIRRRTLESEEKEKELKKELAQLEAGNTAYEKYRVLNDRLIDSKRTEINAFKESTAAIEEYNYMSSATLSRMEKRIEEGVKKSGAAVKTPLTEMQKIDRKIASLKDDLHKLPENAKEEIKRVQEELKTLEGRKLRLELIAKIDPDKLSEQLAPERIKPIEAPILVAAASIDKIRKQIESIEAKIKITTDPIKIRKYQDERNKLQGDIDTLNSTHGLTLPTAPLKNYKEDAKETLNTNQVLVNSFNAISNAIGSITGETDKGVAALFRWGASVASAIGTAIPAIAALTAAKKAESVANTEAAASGAAASTASIPIVGPIMAVAAIASVLAAIASAPKFATGGIVGGNSYHGDKILARLNSGEMVLNRAQIGALGNTLDALDRANAGGRVEFKIRGEELVGVLDRYGRKRDRL